jgi:hypothetical protein
MLPFCLAEHEAINAAHLKFSSAIVPPTPPPPHTHTQTHTGTRTSNHFWIVSHSLKRVCWPTPFSCCETAESDLIRQQVRASRACPCMYVHLRYASVCPCMSVLLRACPCTCVLLVHVCTSACMSVHVRVACACLYFCVHVRARACCLCMSVLLSMFWSTRVSARIIFSSKRTRRLKLPGASFNCEEFL